MRADIAVFHPGVQHSWQTALALQQLERLNSYATSIFYQPDRWPYRVERYLPALLSGRVHAEFRRFAGPPLDPERVETFGLAEWLERLVRRAGLPRVAHRLDAVGNDLFARGVVRLIERRAPTSLWGYNGSSRSVFVDPRAAGRMRILDRTIGDWRAYNDIMTDVYNRYRAFFPAGRGAVGQAQIDADDAEYEGSDVILVGSPGAADTVRVHAPAAAERVRVLPYCFDEALFGDLPPPRERAAGEPVRFLFVGQAGPRKGIHLLLNAISRIPASAAMLTIVGDLQIPPGIFARYADRVVHRATVARTDMPGIMAEADVLVFPSYFEGSALSLLEGLAAGLALIQSANAGLGVTPDTGILLPALTETAVYDAMMTMVDDRPRLAKFRAAAQTEAQRYRFSCYRDRIADLLTTIG